jgi:tetratricopeptide (TPR) repeat protein
MHPTSLFLIVSGLWVALLYARTLTAPFVYDDVLTIQHNPHLSSWHDILSYFRSPVELNNQFRGPAGYIYRPLTWFGFIITRWLSGSSPVGFHLANLAFHWANGVIGFLLLRKLRISSFFAGAACFVWLGLPINSEVVAWISGRHVCQATFFILTSLLAAVSYLQTPKVWLLFGYICALFAALLSIEWAFVALPLTALLVYIDLIHVQEIYLQKRPAKSVREQRTWLTLGVSGVSVFVVEVLMRHWAGAHVPIGSLKIFPVGLSFFKYLSWMILPIGMSMERSTDTPSNEMTALSLTALVGTLAILLLLFTIFRRQAPRVTAGLAWMSICLLPFCGIVFIYQGMAERYCYLASAGLAFALVSVADRLRGHARTLITALLILWVIWGAWRLNARAAEWRDETILFKSSLAVNPRSQVLLYDLGVKAAESGDAAAAISYYRRALVINPSYLNALTNLGNLFRDQGSYSAALDLEKQAIAIDPKAGDLWLNLGDTYLKEGLTDDAIHSYRKALALNNRNLEANIDLGAALQKQGNLAAAQMQYQNAIAIDPQQGAAYCNLGALLLKEGNVDGAINEFRTAVKHDANYYQAYLDLGLVYENQGQKDLAISMFEKVQQLKPNDVNAALHLERLTTYR